MSKIHLKDLAIDHLEAGKEKMLGQHLKTPNILAFMETYLGSVQAVEDAVVELLTERGVYSAEGVQLDVIGFLLNLDRNGMGDFKFRRRILTEIYIQNGNSVANTIQDACMQLTGSPIAKPYEHFPSSFSMACSGYSTDPDISLVIDRTTAIGVKTWYYEMGRTMKWRGADLLRFFDELSTNSYDDGVHDIYQRTNENDTGNIILNTGKNRVGFNRRPAHYFERPKGERGRKRKPLKVKLNEPLQDVSTSSEFVENPNDDRQGVHAELYQKPTT